MAVALDPLGRRLPHTDGIFILRVPEATDSTFTGHSE